MRTILALCAFSLVVAAILLWQVVILPNDYGVFTGAPKAEIVDLISTPKAFLHKTVSIEGTVRQQCTTMGCYFFFLAGDKMLRVDLEQITMYAPRRNGHTAHVEGQIVSYGDSYQFVASAIEFL
jgi:hypothetical protein